MISASDGSAQLLSLAPTAHPIDIASSPAGGELLAWSPGYPGFRWQTRDWQPVESKAPSGAPKISANGHYVAYISTFERTIVDRNSEAALVIARVEPVVSEIGSPIPAALANDGTLALVDPFGGGVVQLLGLDGAQSAIELPGAATALAWIEDRDGQPVLIVGFQDGSIVRVDREVNTTVPIHAGAGGRIWALAQLGGRPGIYLELDEIGLDLHRLDDDALVELHLGDAMTLARHAASPPQDPTSVDFVAVWRPGTAMPACVILDGSRAGVLTSEGVRRLVPSEAPALFEAFASGAPCPKQPAPAPIEPVPLAGPRR